MTLVQALRQWSFDPIPSIGVIVAAIVYGWAFARVASTPRVGAARGTVPRSRAVCFAAGLVALVIAVDGPPDVLSESSFSLHMVQHMLLQMVAAPLLLLGGPVLLLLRADLPLLPRRTLARILRSTAVRVLTNPVAALLTFSVVLVGSHFSPLYGLALQHEWVHELEHVVYFATALIFWWPAVGVDPAPRRMTPPARLFYLFISMPVPALLGVAISNAGRELYPYYLNHPVPWGSSPIADQQLAGTLMWTAGMFTIAPALAVVLMRWLEEESRRQARRERPALADDTRTQRAGSS